jgi:hypothetical protein
MAWGQTLSFRAEQISVQEGQADLKCVQVGIFMSATGYDGNQWNNITFNVEYADPNLILRQAPVGRITRFTGSNNPNLDNFGLTNPPTALPSSTCSVGDIINNVTLGNQSAVSMMRNEVNPSAGASGAFFIENLNEINQRFSFSAFDFGAPYFETRDGEEYLVAIIGLPLKANLSEGDSITVSFQAGAGVNTISFSDGMDLTTADAQGNNTSGSLVIEACGAVSVQSQPLNQTVCDGGTGSFNVSVAGTGPFSYQWRKDSVDLPGETGASLSLSNVSTADSGAYDCVITNACGSVTSDSATLAVDPFLVSAPVTAFTQGLDLITLGVQTECGVDPVTYEWREQPSGNVVGSNPTFTIDPPLETSADFEVEVTSGSGSSAVIEFSVLANSGSIDPNNDGVSNIEDLYFAVSQLWLTTDPIYDVDGSGFVRVNDLLFTFPGGSVD